MKRILATLVLITVTMAIRAQLVVTKDCDIKEGDISGYRLNDREPIVIDGDTIPFALIRVGLAEPGAVFENRWILKQEFKDNEYWLYVMDGVKSMTIKTDNWTPLHYKFPEPIRALSTYTMTIHKPQGEKYKGTITIGSNVNNAEVFIDGNKVSDALPVTYTGDVGKHTIELRAPGFDSQQREINLSLGKKESITINLFKTGSLSVGGVSYGMVPVPAAKYTMGLAEYYYTSPPRQVSIRDFSAGSTLVSVELWEQIMGVSDTNIKGPNGEVVNVSYDQVQDFIRALNRLTGREYRLPTEAEWEYMAKYASRLGLYDITHSLEWCNDWFGKYSMSESINPQGPGSGILRSVRGGTEYRDNDPIYSRPEYRWRHKPYEGSPHISFRLVQDN